MVIFGKLLSNGVMEIWRRLVIGLRSVREGYIF